MFHLFKKSTKNNKELDAAIRKIKLNVENNYKDAAQADLRAFRALLEEMERSGSLTDSQKEYYKKQLAEYQERMKKFTHHDQKATWN